MITFYFSLLRCARQPNCDIPPGCRSPFFLNDRRGERRSQYPGPISSRNEGTTTSQAVRHLIASHAGISGATKPGGAV